MLETFNKKGQNDIGNVHQVLNMSPVSLINLKIKLVEIKF
jgi:hypothetical protein